MKRYERESLIKSFILYFLLMGALYLLFATMSYRDRLRLMDEQILNEMKIFSFKPLGGVFGVGFVPREEGAELMRLSREGEGVYALFEIPGSRKYLMKITLGPEEYRQRLKEIRKEAYGYWPLYLILIAVLALLFSLYTLHPFRKALHLNEEFVRDMLHDINTPLSALRINLNILEKRFGRERTVERMYRSMETIESLQENLRSFLHRRPGAVTEFSPAELLEERLESFRSLYPSIGFSNDVDPGIRLSCDRDAFLRIVENLLSNAAKYNRPGGTVRLFMEGTNLVIEDSGRGIERPEKAFERYYREGERGLGLGLHIVRKLSDELGISLSLTSEVGRGTTVKLDLAKVMLR